MAACWVTIAILVCYIDCFCNSLQLEFVRSTRRHAHVLHVGRNKSLSLHLEVEKLQWLHVPKTATSFANTLVTWACPGLTNCPEINSLRNFFKRHPPQCPRKLENHLCSNHEPIGRGCNALPGGKFVALFRQPEQRLISGFYHDRHDYLGNNGTIMEYARAVAGCAVRMMLGLNCGNGILAKNAADRAIKVLQKFEFIGLTKEFDLSVCLFHRMYGGNCHKREFQNTRPGKHHSHVPYDVSILHGFRDEVDGKLYASAEKIFWSNVHRFAVHRQSCVKVCKAFPDPFLLPSETKFRKRYHSKAEYDWPGRWVYDED